MVSRWYSHNARLVAKQPWEIEPQQPPGPPVSRGFRSARAQPCSVFRKSVIPTEGGPLGGQVDCPPLADALSAQGCRSRARRFSNAEKNKQSSKTSPQTTQLMQMLGKCVGASISHICVRRDCGASFCTAMCITKFAVLSAAATSKHLFTLPPQPALIPRAPPERPQSLLMGWVCVAVSAPDVRGKSGSRCGGRGVKRPAGQRSKGRKKCSKQASRQLVGEQNPIWDLCHLVRLSRCYCGCFKSFRSKSAE